MDNEGIYSVGEDIVKQICQNSKTECFADIRGLSKKTKTKQNKIKNKKRSKMLELLLILLQYIYKINIKLW